MKLLIIIAFALAAQISEAKVPVFKYHLVESNTVDSKCESNKKTSKLKIQVVPNEDIGKFAKVFVKIRICHKSFGYRKSSLALFLPRTLLSQAKLSELAVGQTLKFKNVPNFEGKPAYGLTVERKSDQTIKIKSRNVTAQRFQLKWKVTAGGENIKLLPLDLFVTDRSNLSQVPGINTVQVNPWAYVKVQSEAPMGPVIKMNGPLSEVEWE